MLEIGSSSGLCNRIRLISDWKATSWGKPGQLIRFHWHLSAACSSRWDELFEPLKGVEFVYTNRRPHRWNCRPRSARNALHLFDLRPIDSIQTEVDRVVTEAGDGFAAVHVRRTDIVQVLNKHGGKPIPDKAYFDFLESTDADRYFLATDNQKTQRIFKSRYGNRLVTSGVIRGYGSRNRPVRTTPVSAAVVDLYACTLSRHFMGTDMSSFSWQIKNARRRAGANSG